MIIRIKYCGGCNPRYDRAAHVRRLEEQFLQHTLCYTGEEADYVVVVCGCTAACADHADLHGRYGKTVISKEKDWDALKRHLKMIEPHTD